MMSLIGALAQLLVETPFIVFVVNLVGFYYLFQLFHYIRVAWFPQLIHHISDSFWWRILADIYSGLIYWGRVGICGLIPNYYVKFDEPGGAGSGTSYIVGETISFSIQYCKFTSLEDQISKLSALKITIRRTSQSLHEESIKFITEYVLPARPDSEFVIQKVIFSVRKAGEYKITIFDETNKPLSRYPFKVYIGPGKLNIDKTELLRPGPIILSTTFDQRTLRIKGRDKFDNSCELGTKDINKLSCDFKHADGQSISSGPFPTATFTKSNNKSSTVGLTLGFPEAGFYIGKVQYENQLICHGSFEVVVLTFGERAKLDYILNNEPSWKYHEGKLLALGSESRPGTKIFIYVSPKQLYVRDYLLKFIPLKVATFRVSSMTKIDYVFPDYDKRTYTIGISDGVQPKVIIEMDETSARLVISMFAHFLQRRLGGTESFTAKQRYFYDELKNIRKDLRLSLTYIRVIRNNLLESTYQQTKNFSTRDWCKNFKVAFDGEPGLDGGGPKREWLNQCCLQLFSNGTGSGLFASIGTSRLVHPVPESERRKDLPIKYYETAGKIVGKCLHESAMGGDYKQMVNGRFSRSFLAQVIGLRPNYKHFEQDDPELYLSKIKYILENDVEDMDLTFTEEIYGKNGKLFKSIDLIPHGSKIKVTNGNKEEYLNALANFRLGSLVTKEIEAFTRGLNLIVPDELLTNFDENELELLWCGKSEFNLDDLQGNYLRGNWTFDSGYNRVLEWFWTVISGLSDDEKGKLLQFTTGSSLLPHGGFGDLSPKFKIVLSSEFGKLPTANTCINQIVLSDHIDFENFQRAIKMGINEGSEGFSFA